MKLIYLLGLAVLLIVLCSLKGEYQQKKCDCGIHILLTSVKLQDVKSESRLDTVTNIIKSLGKSINTQLGERADKFRVFAEPIAHPDKDNVIKKSLRTVGKGVYWIGESVYRSGRRIGNGAKDLWKKIKKLK